MSLQQIALYSSLPNTARSHPTHLSVDPQGRRIAYASGKSIIIRSLVDPSQSYQYLLHSVPTTVARFSPSGYYLASADISGALKIWDTTPSDEGGISALKEVITKGEFQPLASKIVDLDWDGESKRIIVVGEGKDRFGAAITFDSGNSVGVIQGHSDTINAISIRKQRPIRAVTVSDDQKAVFFTGLPFKFEKILEREGGTHSNFVVGVEFSPDGRYVVTTGADRKILLWDGSTGDFVKEFVGHTGSVLGVSWAKDGTQLATASADRSVRVWNVETGESTQIIRFEKEGISGQQVGIVWTAREDNLIVSLSLSGELNYLYPNTNTVENKLEGHQGAITALGTSPSGSLLTGSFDGRVSEWEFETGSATSLLGEGHGSTVVGIVNIPSANISASVGWDDKLRFISSFGYVTNKTISLNAQPRSIQPVPLSNYIIVTTTKSVLLIDAVEEKVFWDFSTTFTPTSASTNGTELAISSEDTKIYIYPFSIYTIPSTPTKTLVNHRSPLSTLSFSPNTPHLATADTSGKILLLSSNDYSVVTTRWAFHTSRVTCMAWKDGRLATGGLDNSVYVWDSAKLTWKRAGKGGKDGIQAVGWIGGEVVSGGGDGSVRRWTVKE